MVFVRSSTDVTNLLAYMDATYYRALTGKQRGRCRRVHLVYPSRRSGVTLLRCYLSVFHSMSRVSSCSVLPAQCRQRERDSGRDLHW